MAHGNDLINFEATELRLGLPGTTDECHEEMKSDANNVINFNNINSNKRASAELVDDEESGSIGATKSSTSAPAPKAQIVGWPPVRSYRKSNFKKTDDADQNGNYVKVSMDGAPYLRKIDLKIYNGYPELLKALETMFKLTIGEYSEREGYKGSEYAPAYEDKDGDLMLVGDVPWNMFMSSCKRLRIMKGSDARGLGCAV